MVVVEIMFKIILVAVPAFILVDPVIISGPVSIQIKVSTLVIKWGEGLVTRYTVLAPFSFAWSNAEMTYEAAPLHDMPITVSFSSKLKCSISLRPASEI